MVIHTVWFPLSAFTFLSTWHCNVEFHSCTIPCSYQTHMVIMVGMHVGNCALPVGRCMAAVFDKIRMGEEGQKSIRRQPR